MLSFFYLFFYFSLTSAAILCPSESTEWENFCYFFNSTQLEFAGAEVQCKKIGGHLASVPNGFTNAFLAGTQNFQESTVADFWIGGTTLINPPVWSWNDGSAFTFTEWASNEPSNISAEACAAFSTIQGTWSALDCYKTKAFVCAVPKIPEPPAFEKCPLGMIYFQPTHSCFGLNYTQQTAPIIYNWTMAEEHCISLGGHLPSFHSIDEFNVINSYVLVSVSQFWIGLRSDDGGASWKWTDNSKTDYLPWGKDYPKPMGESCGWQELGAIVNIDCKSNSYFICKKPAS